MQRTPWRRILMACGVTAFVAAPWSTQAVELAELRWSDRFGSGYIVYDRDAVDGVAADGRGSFLDAVRNFDFYALRLPWGSGGITLKGSGGSILSLDKPEPCGDGTCNWSSVSFLLGASHEGDPLSYKLTLRLPFLLDDLDLIPLPAGGGDLPVESPERSVSGWVSNEFNSPNGNYIALSRNTLSHRLLPAPPVPEPETLAMFGLGAGMLAWMRRRRTR